MSVTIQTVITNKSRGVRSLIVPDQRRTVSEQERQQSLIMTSGRTSHLQ